MDLRSERDLLLAPPPGVYADVPMADYLAWDAVSAGFLKDLIERGIGYAERARRVVREDTDATERGTALHSAILEPHDFERRYAPLSPTCDLRTNRGKDEKAALVASGKHPLKALVWEACVRLREKAWENPTLAALLEQAEAEVSATWVLAERAPAEPGLGGLVGKARADVLAREARMILDFKSTDDATEAAFGRTAAGYGYHLSAPWYLDGFTAAGVPVEFWTIGALECVESIGHYDVHLFTLDPAVLQRARERIEKAVREYASAMSTGVAATTGFRPLPLPEWTMKEIA